MQPRKKSLYGFHQRPLLLCFKDRLQTYLPKYNIFFQREAKIQKLIANIAIRFKQDKYARDYNQGTKPL